MTLEFKKIPGEMTYLDPADNFEITNRRFEIRFDPLTQQTGRIVHIGPLRLCPTDEDAMVKRSLELGCPFCKEMIDKKAAKFPADLIPEGRIQKGKAIVIPNIIPFDAHAAVCLLSEDHYVPLDGFTAETLSDLFLASQDFLRRVASRHTDLTYFSINWNYMPPAGSSLVHPHLQPIAGETPTNTQKELIRASHEYISHHLTHYWRDLVEREEKLGERYLGRIGRSVWMVPFVPSGYYPDTMAVFWECLDLLSLEEPELMDFSSGLVKVFRFYHAMGIRSLNLSLFSGVKGGSTLWVHARMTPRAVPHPIGNSDMTYFGMLHKEPVCLMTPEDIAAQMKSFFSS